MKLKSKLRTHWYTIIIGMLFVLLGFLAVFLAGSLYLTRNTSIAPNAPASNPGATDNNTCQGFSVTFEQTAESPLPTDQATQAPSPTESPLALLSTSTPTPTESPIPTETASPVPTTSSTSTPAPTITSSPQPTSTPRQSFECNSICSSDSECKTIGTGYTCYNTGNGNRCRLQNNQTSETCGVQKTVTTSGTIPSPVANELPKSGVSLPTTFILGLAVVLILGGFLLI